MKPPKVQPRQLAALQDAIALHNQGRLDEADAVYSRFLREVPGHPDALHLRALVAHARGAFAEATRFAEAAIAQAPRIANFHNTAGEAWRRQGQPKRALQRLQEAVRLDPAMAMAHQNLALVLCELGQMEEALARCRRALELAPASAEARAALAEILARQARAHCAQAQFEVARAAAREATQASASFWGGWAVLAEAENELGDAAQAELHCSLAANLAPDNRDARLNLAHLLREQGRAQEAQSHYEGWLAQHPDDAAARFGQAVTRLAQGDYAGGWPAYESRWAVAAASDAHAALPRWTGGPSEHLLVYPEQGLGDFLQMLRFVPEAARRAGGRVTLLVPAPLERLARRNLPAAIDVATALADAGAIRHACPVMSLPLQLGVDSAGRIAAPVPYLRADPQRSAQLRKLLSATPGRKLGLVWQGAAGSAVNRRRALAEAALAPLLALPGWTAVSLQFGVPAPVVAGRRLLDLSAEIRDFEDLAGAMQAVDAVVSLDTGPAHLAGALGLPCHMLLPRLHDWRWGSAGERCDWYPTMTLVRQDDDGSWEGALRQLAAALSGGTRYRPPAARARAAGAVRRNLFPTIELAGPGDTSAVPLFDAGATRALLLQAAGVTSPAAASPPRGP